MKRKLTLLILGLSGISLGVFIYALFYIKDVTIVNFYEDPEVLSLLIIAISFLVIGFSQLKSDNKKHNSEG